MKYCFWLLLFFPHLLLAEEVHPLLSAEEVELRAIVRGKQFVGGKDEEPIRVQSQLPVILKKAGHTGELEVPEPPTLDPATD